MNKTISMAGMSLIATETAVAATPQVSQVVEVAIYRVKEPETYPALLKNVMREVKAMPGFISGVHLRSLTDPQLFADINFWEKLELAEAAAQNVHTKPMFKPFMDSFSELKVFGHFLSAAPVAELDRFLEPGAAIELASYSVKDIETQKRTRQNVYRELQNNPSFYGGMPLSSLKTSEGYIDFIAWTSQQEAEETAAKVMAMQEHEAFFQNTDEVKLFEFFTVYDQNGLLK